MVILIFTSTPAKVFDFEPKHILRNDLYPSVTSERAIIVDFKMVDDRSFVYVCDAKCINYLG